MSPKILTPAFVRQRITFLRTLLNLERAQSTLEGGSVAITA